MADNTNIKNAKALDMDQLEMVVGGRSTAFLDGFSFGRLFGTGEDEAPAEPVVPTGPVNSRDNKPMIFKT